MRTRRIPALLGVLCVFLSGCLSRPALVKQNFAFTVPPVKPSEKPGEGRVAALRRLTVAAPFDSQSLTYRTGEFTYERDPYAQFLVPPADALETPIRASLANSGAFSAIAQPGSALRPDTLLEMTVEQLYGDFRQTGAPAAVLTLRVVVFNAPNGLPGKVLLDKAYAERVPVSERTAAGVMAGFNQCLKDAMSQLAANLHSLAM